MISQDFIEKVNAEREMSDRLTKQKLDTITQGNKQNYKSMRQFFDGFLVICIDSSVPY